MLAPPPTCSVTAKNYICFERHSGYPPVCTVSVTERNTVLRHAVDTRRSDCSDSLLAVFAPTIKVNSKNADVFPITQHARRGNGHGCEMTGENAVDSEVFFHSSGARFFLLSKSGIQRPSSFHS